MAFCKLHTVFKNERGQVLLIVVLVMVTTLTVGLSFLSRNITNLKTSTEEANSQKALSAAEAGVERAIQTGGLGNPSATVAPNTYYSANVTQVQGTELALKDGATIDEDDSVDVWLSDYPNFANPWNGGNLEIFWGTPSTSCPNQAALEVAMLKEPLDSPVINRYAIDPCPRSPTNSFDTTGISSNQVCGGATYPYKKTLNSINSGGTPVFMRILTIYAPTPICIHGPNGFPKQGFIVDSVGNSGSTQRKLRVYQGYPRPPVELFPFNLFQP